MSVASDTQHGVDFPKGLLTIKMCCADRGAGNHEAVCWGRVGWDNVCRRSLAAPAHMCAETKRHQHAAAVHPALYSPVLYCYPERWLKVK